jgi:hypothetical protein
MLGGDPDAVRMAERKVLAERPHDHRIDYEPPNPKLVIPRPSLTLELLAAVLAIILFALILLAMFNRWMLPGSRQPGERRQSPGLEQKLP